MLGFKILGFIAVVATFAAGTDYCSSKICPNGRKHIACGNIGKFATSCPKGARMVDFKPHISTILTLHNQKRNSIAGGKLKGYKSAARMATMEWDDELAKIASYNVKQCAMKHNGCFNTERFAYAGQNLGMYGYSGQKLSDNSLIRNRIDGWWNEYKVCKMSYIDRYPSSYSGTPIGHFTVMARENNIRVGCAASRYNDGDFQFFLMACNYATTNFATTAVYRSGSPVSGCKTGKNPLYKYLCSTSEVFSV